MSDKAEAVWAAADERGTVRLAELLAGWAEPGAILALDGDLGAGKTRFSQAFAKALGVREPVNSPTFTIIKEYEGRAMPFYHMDVYRLSQEEAGDLGLDDYFYGEGVTIVEWASLIGDLLPSGRLDVRIGHLGGEGRRFVLTGTGLPYSKWCERLQAMEEGDN